MGDPFLGRESTKKTSQGGLVGKALQSDQRTEQSIVLKQFGFIDAWRSKHTETPKSDPLDDNWSSGEHL